MKNPNQRASKSVLERLKEASNERMRVELKNSIELKMKDYDMTWDDLAQLLGMIERKPGYMVVSRADKLKQRIIGGRVTLNDLNTLTHLFSCEAYIIFRPRFPWTNS